MIADLHVHTIFSDGLLTPEEIVDLAVKKNLNGLAITDHDTILGIDRAIKRSRIYEEFFIIPGIELSCIHKDEEVHILGYFIDYHSPDIIKLTEKLKTERIIRSKKIVNKLNQLGMSLSLEDVKQFTNGEIVGRPHIARALIKNKWVADMKEAFNDFLNRGKPAYVERYKLSIDKAINLIHNTGGIAIIAHPGLIKNEDTIYDCIQSGIDGMEVVHSKHSNKQVLKLINLANKYNLIKTGGSDCHGDIINGRHLLGEYYININNIPLMKGRVESDNL